MSKQKLVIVVSHDLELAEKYADRIISIKDGKIVNDIEVSEEKIKSNCYYANNELNVVYGSELDKNETALLLNAIRDKKKVNFFDKFTVREKVPTNESLIESDMTGQVLLIDSKMKYRSCAEFGIRSLKVKPLRLIFTILLSIIAFTIFGIFVTVASYNKTDMICNTLKDLPYNTFSVTSEYRLNDSSSYKIKLSQSDIDALNKKTRLSFKGVYDIFDYNINSANKECVIEQLKNFDITKGKTYYYKTVNGMVEFSTDEGNGNKINDYGFKVVYGEYPKLQYVDGVVDEETMYGVGVTVYTLDCIKQYIGNGEFPFYYDGKYIENYEDFIGSKITAIYSSRKQSFTINAIIDCGEIPKKFDTLRKTLPNSESNVVADEFKTMITSGGYNLLFVPSGFVNEYRNKNNRGISYYGQNSNSIVFTADNKEHKLTSSFYNVSDYKGKEKVIYFDEERNGKYCLDDGEAIVSAHDLMSLFDREIELLNDVEKNEILENCRVLTSKKISIEQKNDAMIKFLKTIGEVKNGRHVYARVEKNIIENQRKIKKDFEIVGVYFDIDDDVSTYGSWRPLMLNKNDIGGFENYSEQGIYSRLISTISNKGARKVALLMTNSNGVGLVWFNNFVLETVEDNEQTVRQFFNLFLYLAILLALFSMFMLFNYISTSIVSKKQSIGVIRALGASGKDIFLMFITEGLLIACVNAIGACFLTGVACVYLNIYIKEIMSIGVNFASFSLRQVAFISGISIITGFLASLIPIIKICKQKPVKLIRK